MLLLVAMNYKAVAQVVMSEKVLPPRITSFTASKTRIMKGEEITLKWNVFRADHIWLASGFQPNSMECLEKSFGEMKVKPEKDTTYRLYAWTRLGHVFQEIKVEVVQLLGACIISGQILKDKIEYGTIVGIYSPDDTKKPLFSRQVDSQGGYSFSSVPAGVYLIIPKGKLPVDDKLGINYIPLSTGRVTCSPGESNKINFRVGSTEG
jgi:hypothetical protein